MADLMDYVGVMADQIGPRPVSTEEEHQTSLYIAQELTDDGLDVDVDEFATPTGTRWPYAIAFALTIAGALISGVGIFVRSISLTMFVVGIVLIAAGLFIYYTEINNKPVLSKMRAGGVSQNVVARYVPSSVRREQRRRKVIVVAHVDTVRSELEAAPALIKHTALLRRIVYYTMIGIAVLTVVRLLPIPWPSAVDTVLWAISLVGCVYLLAALVCIVARRFTPYVSGGNDNASADAVLLGVAKRITDPEERERHAAKRRAEAEAREAAEAEAASRQEQGAAAAVQTAQPVAAAGQPAAEGAVDEPTRAFTPVEADAAAQQQPVVHDAQAAYAAGVVPDGAEISYEQVAGAAEATTVIPQAGAAGDAAQQSADETVVMPGPVAAAGADVAPGETAVIPQPTYPEIVEDPNAATQAPQAQAGAAAPAQPASQQPEGYQPLPDDLFAQTPAESVQAQVGTQTAPAAQQPAQSVQPAQPVQAPAAQQPAVAQAPQAPAQPQASSPAQQAQPAQAPQAGASQAQQRAKKSVPSWYKAAKEKAAKDLEARGGDDEAGEEAAPPEGFRSRYAHIPVTGSMANVRRAMIQEETTAEEKGELVAPAQQVGASEAQSQDQTQEAQPGQHSQQEQQTASTQLAAEAPAAQPVESTATQTQAAQASQPAEPAGTESAAQESDAQETHEPLDFGILGDDIDDDISPDMSGVFEALQGPDDQAPRAIRDSNEIADSASERAESAEKAEKRRKHLGTLPAFYPEEEEPQFLRARAEATLANQQSGQQEQPESVSAGPASEEPAVGESASASAANEPAAERKGGILKGLTSRIPIIGSSNELEKNPARGDRAQSEDAAEPVQDGSAAEQPKPKPKPERRKPTARHITQEFQPTRPVNEREAENESEKLSTMRQEVAVSSTYEDTPQAGPEYDPFVPKDEQPYDAYGNANPASSSPFPSLSGQGQSGGADSFGSPGNSASFPSLSGSFPSLSGQMPRVNPNDFGDSYDVDYGYEPTSEDVAEDFGNPNLTGEINIPDSRFHNAMDKVGGLFNRKDKKAKKEKKHRKHGRRAQEQEEGYDNFDDGNVDNWDEDDDFGWKGGAYVPDGYGDSSYDGYGDSGYDGYGDDGREPRPGSEFEAAKARAAEIRDSVIEMTESDLLDKEVWFVALGASGAGNQGMKNFLEIHGPELRGSLIINLEAVGAGTIHYVDFEGTGKSRKSDRRLQTLVRKSSKNLDGAEMRPQKLDWRNTDATPAMAAGLRAMTIMGFDGPAPVAWHWSDDTSDIVRSENLEYVTELVLDMIENS